MREIKCRAWDKDFNKWLTIFPCVIPTERDGKTFRLQTSDNIEVVWWTGLKDKNGKEIYEGDIVNSQALTLIVGHIVYRSPEFRIDFQRKEGLFRKKLKYFTCKLISRHTEVIGNIYENKELLKATKEP